MAFCSESLAVKRSYNVPNNNNKMGTTLSTVVKNPLGNGLPAAAPSQAEVVQQNQEALCVDYARSCEATNRLLYPIDPSVGLDEKEIEEITKACTVSQTVSHRSIAITEIQVWLTHNIPSLLQILWRLQEGYLTEECVRETNQGVRRGLLVGKPPLPPFQHQAFVLNCSVMGTNTARRQSVVKWDDIIEDAFDTAWETTYPHPVDGRDDEVWNFSSEVIVIDDD